MAVPVASINNGAQGPASDWSETPAFPWQPAADGYLNLNREMSLDIEGRPCFSSAVYSFILNSFLPLLYCKSILLEGVDADRMVFILLLGYLSQS